MDLLRIESLEVRFRTQDGPLTAVDGLSLSLAAAQTVGLVGESGCGKSVTTMAVLGLLPQNGSITGGTITFAGQDLASLSAEARRRLRGNEIALVSQDPLAALNPVHTVGAQVAEGLRLHRRLGRKAAWEQAVEALAEVGLPSPRQRARDYPHQLSGGQRQRVVIAMAIALRPRLLIADEPTTALDVSVQAQILELLRRLQAEHQMAVLLITHDLGVVAEMAETVTVMRRGQVVEQAPTERLFEAPEKAYTKALLAALPRLDDERERLAVIDETADA